MPLKEEYLKPNLLLNLDFIKDKAASIFDSISNPLISRVTKIPLWRGAGEGGNNSIMPLKF